MKKVFYFLGLFVGFLTVGTVRAESIDIQREYYDNGNIQSEYSLLHGKLNGIFKAYKEDGSLLIEGNYLNGELDGLLKTYDEKGDLKIESNFKNGIKDGIERRYQCGKLVLEREFINGDVINNTYFKISDKGGECDRKNE